MATISAASPSVLKPTCRLAAKQIGKNQNRWSLDKGAKSVNPSAASTETEKPIIARPGRRLNPPRGETRTRAMTEPTNDARPMPQAIHSSALQIMTHFAGRGGLEGESAWGKGSC